MAAEIAEHFKDLDEAIKSSSWPVAIKLCDKILAQDAKDKEALQCKLVCLVQASRFDEALAFLDASSELKAQFRFEYGYCLYRAGRLDEALRLIASFGDKPPHSVLQLKAQVCYRKEDWGACISAFETLLAEGDDSVEIKTNLAAAYCLAGKHDKVQELVRANKGMMDKTFEFAYNAAYSSLTANQYQQAEKFLRQAEETCKESLTADGLSAAEIDEELAVIRVQLAYVQQVQGSAAVAIETYNAVLANSDIKDQHVRAVAANNLVSLRKAHDLFDSEKKLKRVRAPEVQSKLTLMQRRTVALNFCLLSLHMAKIKECKEQVASLQGELGDSDVPALLLAAAEFKSRRAAEAEKLLLEYISHHAAAPQRTLRCQLALAQCRLVSADLKGVVAALQSIEQLRGRPGVVATLVALYERLGDVGAAATALDENVAWWEQRRQPAKGAAAATAAAAAEALAGYVSALSRSGQFKLKHHIYQGAAEAFERVLAADARNTTATASLVVAASRFDPSRAEKYHDRLPPLPASVGFDLAKALEAAAGARLRPQQLKASQDRSASEQVTQKKKKQTRRKRKPLYPKDFDPEHPENTPLPDPERWIPRHKRAAFQKRRAKRGVVAKGTQGSMAASASIESVPAATATATAAKSPPPSKQVQQQRKKKGR